MAVSAIAVLEQLIETGSSVILAVLPLAALFLLFQVLFLQLPLGEVKRILLGTLVASAGLFLFLLGVSIALLPYGRAIGEALGALPQKWILAAFGVLLGFVTTWGEPAVRILANQVEEASSGSIRSSLVVVTVCIGVAVWVGIGMLRISYGIPLSYLVVPGYLFVLLIMPFTEKTFVGIAVDAGWRPVRSRIRSCSRSGSARRRHWATNRSCRDWGSSHSSPWRP